MPVRRVDCLECGRVTEQAPASCLTRRLCAWIESLLQLLPISHICQLSDLHWHTIKILDKRLLEASVEALVPGDVRRLVMDEFPSTRAIVACLLHVTGGRQSEAAGVFAGELRDALVADSQRCGTAAHAFGQHQVPCGVEP